MKTNAVGFGAALAAFEAAARSRPGAVVESHYTMAGLPVRLRVVGRDLATRMSQAIRHMRSERSAARLPALAIDVWDRRETGVDWPEGPWHDQCPNRWDTGRGRIMSSRDNRVVGCVTERGETWLDRRQRRLVGYWSSGSEMTLLEHGKPLFFLLSLWQRDHGVRVVHAALVSRGQRGVLLPGATGAGKSTSALACALSGFQFLGDDHVALGHADGKWVGHCMYGSAWLDPGHLERFPLLKDRALEGTPPPADKRLILLDADTGWLAQSAEIRAVAIPRVCDAERSAHRPASRAEALRALCMGTLSGVVPRPGPEDLAFLADLVDRVPCAWIDVGRRIEDIPRGIDALLEEVAPA